MAVNWIEYRERGFYCIPGDFHLDPHGVVPLAVVSHAHADHYPRGLGEVHASPATLAIARTRYRTQSGKVQHAHAYGEPFQIGPVTLELIPAGHMLGSAQILMHYQGETVLYTGDLSLRPNPTCEPLQAPQVPIDLLISESTFAAKQRHAAPAEALKQTIDAAGFKPLMIAVYPLGKAQHVTHLLTSLVPQMPVLLHYEVYRYHQVYEAHGFRPGNYTFYRRQDRKSMLLPHAYLVTPKVMSGYAKDYNYHKVMASGWEAKQRYPYLDGNLDISDHVDALDIQAYLALVKPKQVWFWHGSPGPLLAWCAEQGISAREIRRGEVVVEDEDDLE